MSSNENNPKVYVEPPGFIDMERMANIGKALNSPMILMPFGLSREERRHFILDSLKYFPENINGDEQK